ncbi:FSR family fosmidomycin resistance protein-like MFS transporter [Nocardioides luteus]|uniref:MFS transporter n=1 Tax=Nocardioides luteus TaxID=1844 RepID=A0ABQ5SRV3_9ACTN|nr:MFS transporter [Nocardioides luteus]MDR7313464.1 FSR family fosmidomycin resistance protein-like MFS transporter [Nocardioides luteus]GGR61036.1 MFS transporter [Nocardioides luteus]GLJ66529.1 MFS transporter [Nocardioides luteus]
MQRNRAIWLLAVGHACVDVYQGAVAALVPFFIAERDYTYAAASGIVLAASLLSSVTQPVFGVLTDRRATRWVVPFSTLAGGVGIAMSGLGGSYALTLTFAAVSGIGVAAYHPEAARLARVTSAGSHRAMAIFSTGGNVGFALAPLLVAASVATGGLRLTPVLVVPALIGVTVTLPVLTTLVRRRTTGPTAHHDPRADDVAAFVRLSFAVVFRSVAFVGLGTFIALYAQQRLGGSTAAGTAALFVLYAGGIVGSLLGGSLAHRWDRVTVSRWSYVLTAAAITGVVWAPGPPMYLLVALSSVGLYVPFSLQVTLGQDYLPARVGTASGITLGLTVSIGGLASPVIGAVVDATSLQTALTPLIAMPLLSWVLYRTLNDPRAARGPADGFPDAGVLSLSHARDLKEHP